MKGFTHLRDDERSRISRWKKEGKSLRWIAEKLGRSVSTLSEELKRNQTKGAYDAVRAGEKAYLKRKFSKLQCLKVAVNPELKKFVTEQIEDDQSPAGISGRIKEVEKTLPQVSAKAIYKFVRSWHGRRIEKHLWSKAVRKKGGPKHKKPVMIDGRTTIDERPKKVEKRFEFGHFEGDFIESGKDGKGSILVLVERKSRYPYLAYCEDRSTAAVNKLVADMLRDVPVKSITIDNDISFQKHAALSLLLDAPIFFCHPQCPQEKGTVENRNKILRRYFKKRSDLSSFSLEYIQGVEAKLRRRFMAVLDYRTPEEVCSRELQKQKQPRVRGVQFETMSIITS